MATSQNLLSVPASACAGTYCPIHHQPASLCDAPELADALDTLRDLGIDPQLVPDHAFLLDQCGGCDEADWSRETAVVRIGYTASNGARWHTDACPLCLDAIVRDHRAHATDVRGYIPVPAVLFGPVGAVA